jgi:hypothetical protein
LSFFYLVVTSGLLIGGSLWLDRRGELTAARVTGKQEEITVQQVAAGGWHRWHRLGVEFDTRDGSPGMATVTVPEQRYDALHLGDTIQVRYLPFFPLLARAADQSTRLVARDSLVQFAADPFLIRLILWIVAGAAGLWIAARIATPVIALAGLAWIALGVPFLFPAPSSHPPVTAESTARVTSVTLIIKAPARNSSRSRSRVGRRAGDSVRRLAMPYEVVQLRFAPEGRPDSIVAVDAVDSASVAGLAVGAIVPIAYDPAVPRQARMTLGNRTFRERNRYHMLGPMIGIGVLGMLGAWGWRHRRTRRARVASSAGESAGTPSSIGAAG